MSTTSRPEHGVLEVAGATMVPQFQLSDNQWYLISDLFPDPPLNLLGGRPFRKNLGALKVFFMYFLHAVGGMNQPLPLRDERR